MCTANDVVCTTNAVLRTTNVVPCTTSAVQCTTNAVLCTKNAVLCTTNAVLSPTSAVLSTTNAALCPTSAVVLERGTVYYECRPVCALSPCTLRLRACTPQDNSGRQLINPQVWCQKMGAGGGTKLSDRRGDNEMTPFPKTRCARTCC